MSKYQELRILTLKSIRQFQSAHLLREIDNRFFIGFILIPINIEQEYHYYKNEIEILSK